jgi:hypothetical protein
MAKYPTLGHGSQVFSAQRVLDLELAYQIMETDEQTH